MKEYELTVLIHPDLEIDIEKPLEKIRSIITSAGGTITKEDNWGKKRLAYRINREDFAVYVYFEVSLPADAPLKISNTLNITEEVFRYLLVLVDEKGKKALQEAAEREASRTSSSDDRESE